MKRFCYWLGTFMLSLFFLMPFAGAVYLAIEGKWLVLLSAIAGAFLVGIYLTISFLFFAWGFGSR